MTDAVLVDEVGDGITQITLNRPERLNAMNRFLHHRLRFVGIFLGLRLLQRRRIDTGIQDQLIHQPIH